MTVPPNQMLLPCLTVKLEHFQLQNSPHLRFQPAFYVPVDQTFDINYGTRRYGAYLKNSSTFLIEFDFKIIL
jgi:hypothetical protein